MNLHTRFLNRDFTERLSVPSAIVFEVDRYSHAAIGGPDRARIRVSGTLLDLWRLTDYLRTPVEIYDNWGETVWWGFVNEMRIQTRAIEFTLSLTPMANSIDVRYTTTSTGQSQAGTSALAGVAVNQDSIDEFGTKQMIASLTEANETDAQDHRDTLLESLAYPRPQDVEARDVNQASVTLLCHGWWKTLEWRYYSEPATAEVHNNNPTTTQPFGDTTTEKVGQTFTVSSSDAFLPIKIDVMLASIGSPAGDVTVSIYTISGGLPDTLIDSDDITGSTIIQDVNTTWYTATLDSATDLAASTQYWLEIKRTAAGDASNYFTAGVDENAAYTGGQFYTHNGTVWAGDATKDMPFVVTGTRDTNTQITDLLDGVGEFITGYDVPATARELPARNQSGNINALEIVEQLLRHGTSNDKRLVAEVTPGRRLVVSEETVFGNDNIFILSNNAFENKFGISIPLHQAHKIVRRWATPKDLITVIGNQIRFADLGNQFVEHAEYTVRNDRLRVRMREASDLFDLARLAAR